ncbi:MAG TPA: MW1434 family type I TA system toxin [Ferruginibacter sp.]|nr:MW1434 family type I TA system toxin [Ferruginibacter sp.]
MKLQEALDLLQEGEVLCREVWGLDDGYLTFMKGMQHVWKIVLQPSPNAGNYIFSMADLLADDWEIFEMPKLPLEAKAA